MPIRILTGKQVKVCSLKVDDVFTIKGLPFRCFHLIRPIKECGRSILIQYKRFGKVWIRRLRMTDYVIRVTTNYDWWSEYHKTRLKFYNFISKFC